MIIELKKEKYYYSNINFWHFSLMTNNYKGIFIEWGKYWKGIYWHFPTFTIRTFIFGIDWYSTKEFNKQINIEKGK